MPQQINEMLLSPAAISELDQILKLEIIVPCRV